jgi:hypothetical protein
MAISAVGEKVPDGGVCTVKAKCLLVAVVGVNLLACLSTALGDGGVFIRRKTYTNADVLQPTQKVYIRYDGSQEKLLIQTKYEGPAEEMVWLVPVPSQPTVEKADGSVFQVLSKETSDLAIDYTDFASLNMSTWGATAGIGGGSDISVVEWYERIGDFEITLLRPVGGEDVAQWLNANGYAVPEAINPILEDYVRAGWWMVAAKIAPEALTPITRDKLARGTLHPLEMTFQSAACIYPMRLTGMAGGPVEELIYVEGPHHYEPATLTGNDWEISLFGGPVRKVLSPCYLSAIEHAVEILAGRTRTEVKPRLTKLRRVFQPSEMTEDLVFREMDLAQWLTSKDPIQLKAPVPPSSRRPAPATETDFARQFASSVPVRMAQAATQYGRWRDPNGILLLVSALTPEILDQVKPAAQDYQPWSSPSARFLNETGIFRWDYPATSYDWPAYPGCTPLRNCIWALGEIAIEHALSNVAEEALLRCAQHDNQIIRMEAYVALAKMRSEKLGSVLLNRLADVIPSAPVLASQAYTDFGVQYAMAEMDILAEWVGQFGTTDQRTTLLDLLKESVAKVPVGSEYFITERQAYMPIAYGQWPTWLVWRGACAQDSRLIPVLESRHLPCTGVPADCVPVALLRAEAACGSTPAVGMMVQQAINDANEVLQMNQSQNIPYTSLNAYYQSNLPWSLRVTILRKRGLRYEFYPMPSDAADSIFRSAMSDAALPDWARLHLLARIKRPQSQDEETLMRIWDKHERDTQLLVAGVMYVWNDEDKLFDLYNRPRGLPEAKSEIAWALAAMVVPEAATLIEEQTRSSWNPAWLSAGRAFVHEDPGSRGFPAWTGKDYLSPDARRAEQTLWNYFHPTSGELDAERLASLKRLAADRTIHAGMRFDLLGADYGGTDWGLPLLEQAAWDILAVDSSSATLQRIMSTMKSVGNSGFMVAPNEN